jgi:hypothetical protein
LAKRVIKNDHSTLILNPFHKTKVQEQVLKLSKFVVHSLFLQTEYYQFFWSFLFLNYLQTIADPSLLNKSSAKFLQLEKINKNSG